MYIYIHIIVNIIRYATLALWRWGSPSPLSFSANQSSQASIVECLATPLLRKTILALDRRMLPWCDQAERRRVSPCVLRLCELHISPGHIIKHRFATFLQLYFQVLTSLPYEFLDVLGWAASPWALPVPYQSLASGGGNYRGFTTATSTPILTSP